MLKKVVKFSFPFKMYYLKIENDKIRQGSLKIL